MRMRPAFLAVTALFAASALSGCGYLGSPRGEATDPQIEPGQVSAAEAGQYEQVGEAFYSGPDTGSGEGESGVD